MNTNETNKPELQGWKDVVITPQMSVDVLVQFLNVLNQRLVTVEDNLTITDQQGRTLKLTEAYAEQTKAQMQEEEQKKGQ